MYAHLIIFTCILRNINIKLLLLLCVLAFNLVTSSPPCYLYVPMHDGTLEKKHGHELSPLKCISAIGEYDN